MYVDQIASMSLYSKKAEPALYGWFSLTYYLFSNFLMTSSVSGNSFVSSFEYIFSPLTVTSKAPPDDGISSIDVMSDLKWLNNSSAKLAAFGA
nr:hypothetical protein [Evansella halocellulosilytica]